MPRWVHRQKEKMCIFTHRKNAERLEVIAAQAIAQTVKSSWPHKRLTQVLWLREGFKSWVLCFSPTHRFVQAKHGHRPMPPPRLTQTETRPKAKTETRPTALNKANRTSKGQCRNTAALSLCWFHRPNPAHSQPCARGQQAKQTLPHAGADGQRPRNFNKRLIAHAAVGASAKRENVYFYEQKKC